MYYGTDLKLKKNHAAEGFGGGVHVMGKDKPRPGAAMGQGMGMGGYDHSTVKRAYDSVRGAGKSPMYYSGGARER